MTSPDLNAGLNLADLAAEAENDLALPSLPLHMNADLTYVLRHPLALGGPSQDALFDAIRTLPALAGADTAKIDIAAIRASIVSALAATVEDEPGDVRKAFDKFGIREAAALLRHYVARVMPEGEASTSPAS